MSHPKRIRGDRAFLCRGVVPTTGASVFALTPWPVGAPSWLGASFQVSIEEAGIAPDACEERPAVLRLSLTLSGGEHTVRGHVDRELRRALAGGDVVWLGVDRRGGVGLSVVRGDRLVCAVGAITGVPLADVSARHAPERWMPAAWLGPGLFAGTSIRRHEEHRVPLLVRAPAGLQSHVPIRDRVEGELTLFVHTRLRVARPVTTLPLGQADWVDAYGIESECAAIARVGACPVVAAGTSAMLLHADGLTSVG